MIHAIELVFGWVHKHKATSLINLTKARMGKGFTYKSLRFEFCQSLGKCAGEKEMKVWKLLQ